MTRAALTDTAGTVHGVIIIDDTNDYEPGDGLTLVVLPDDSPVAPGWAHDGDTFTAPPEPPEPGPSPQSLIQSQLDELTDLLIDLEVI